MAGYHGLKFYKVYVEQLNSHFRNNVVFHFAKKLILYLTTMSFLTCPPPYMREWPDRLSNAFLEVKHFDRVRGGGGVNHP